jgi:hypothetical protein
MSKKLHTMVSMTKKERGGDTINTGAPLLPNTDTGDFNFLHR